MVKGMDSNWKHLKERALSRCSEETMTRFEKTFVFLCSRAKERKLPNCSWYRVVRDRKNTCLGYICGQGVYISTILTTDMVVRGVEI